MPDAELHPALATARYRSGGKGDRFVGLWLDVLVTVRNGRSPRPIVEQFFAGEDLRDAIATVGQDQVDTQLRDAARLYSATCLTDPSFSSGLLGLQRLRPEEVARKLDREIRTGVDALAGLGGEGTRLARLLAEGHQDATGTTGESRPT